MNTCKTGKSQLKADFKKALLRVYSEGKKRLNYKAVGMLDALTDENFIEKIEGFVGSSSLSYGFSKLYPDNLDLSIEYVILNEDNGKYRQLFNGKTLKQCEKHLNLSMKEA